MLFSDKAISWQKDNAIELAWSRWYRRAVDGAVAQLNGAERWLDLHPDRVFTDKYCTQPLPVSLPRKAHRITHLVAVVSGAEAACRRYFSDPRGSLGERKHSLTLSSVTPGGNGGSARVSVLGDTGFVVMIAADAASVAEAGREDFKVQAPAQVGACMLPDCLLDVIRNDHVSG